MNVTLFYLSGLIFCHWSVNLGLRHHTNVVVEEFSRQFSGGGDTVRHGEKKKATFFRCLQLKPSENQSFVGFGQILNLAFML